MGVQSVIEKIQNETLEVSSVDPDPLKQFQEWYGDALRAEVFQPDAMHLCTVSRDGVPSGRYVLYKDPERYGLPSEGFLFFTDFRSPKSKDIMESSQVALTFYWKELHRQMRIEGTAETVSKEISDRYFETRPEASKLSAWASSQSEVIESRAVLEERVERFRKRFEGRTIPRPEYWGGFFVRPREIEFWKHREDRLHDRVWYRLEKDGSWTRCRLSP